MAVFIEARTEPFQAERERITREVQDNGRDFSYVRRPTRGIQIKEDTYAVIRIMGPDGEFMPVIDAAGETWSEEEGGNVTTFYTNFFIRSVAEQRQEKQQIVETFGESFIFFFGEAPRMLQVQGLLLNTADFNWRAEFWYNYDKYFRGTRLVERGARLYLIYDDIIVEGYMIGANAQESSAPNPHVIPLSFNIFVTGYSNISRIGDPDFPAPTDIDYAQLSSYETAIQDMQRNRNLQRELSTQAVLAQNRRRYQLGVGSLLADTVRANIINAGDPSVSSFVARAYRAVRIQQQDLARAAAGTDNPALPAGRRDTPLRQQFGHNIDEFIGTPSQTARELASPLSMAERWLEMDRQVDNGLFDLFTSGGTDESGVNERFNPSERHFWDLMGRAGRAESEIRSQGGYRNAGQSITRGLLVGAGVQGEKIGLRDIPYGMTAITGELV